MGSHDPPVADAGSPIRQATKRNARAVPLLAIAAVGLVCVALLTSTLVPLFDPDEGYYPATAAESLDAGAWWDLRFNAAPRWDKPVLAYALIDVAFAMFGRSTATARIPSALEGGLLVLVVGVIVSALAGRRAGALSATVLATTLGVQIFARVAHPEIAVVLSIATTQLLLAIWLIRPADHRPGLSTLIGMAIGYGLLAKGPVAVAIPALCLVVAAPVIGPNRQRWRFALRDALIASMVAGVIAAPWYGAMTARHGIDFLKYAVWQQNVGRYTGQLSEHRHSIGILILPTAFALVPWTTFLLRAVRAIDWRRPHAGPRQALAFWMAVSAAITFVFYSLSASTLASYSLALLPPLSVLIGTYLDDELAKEAALEFSFRASAGMLGVLAMALVLVPVSGRFFTTRELIGGVPGSRFTTALLPIVIPAAAELSAAALLVCWLTDRRRIAVLCCLGVLLPATTLVAARPVLEEAYPWRHFGERIASSPGRVWIHAYRAPSLTFYAGRPVQRVRDEQLEELLQRSDPGWLVIEASWLSNPGLMHRITTHRAVVVDRTARLLLLRLNP
jgi:4-amino-4-deoxy-L-arabinose transferase-like glycosyltransferase